MALAICKTSQFEYGVLCTDGKCVSFTTDMIPIVSPYKSIIFADLTSTSVSCSFHLRNVTAFVDTVLRWYYLTSTTVTRHVIKRPRFA